MRKFVPAANTMPSFRRRMWLGLAAAALPLIATPAFASTIFTGNLVVSALTYEGSAATVSIGQALPYNASGSGTGSSVSAIANGAYGNVFQNDTVDSNFGVTAPYALQFFNSNGATANLTSTYNIADAAFTGSFSSKSEGAINVSADGKSITLIGYNSGINQLDISNANTPGSTEGGNTDTAAATYRTVAQVNSNGSTLFTNTNAYSGNNPRAVILAADGYYYAAGNAGNGNKNTPGNIATLTGVQRITPGAGPNNTQIGSYSITQQGYAADKTAKDNNFRGETIFGNTLYVSKGSGSNGINTVYQVGMAGTLPTTGNASTPITILPGFPTELAKNDTSQFPFGVWFANSTTAYVADEGDGTLADATSDPYAGLEKWSFNGSTWTLDYVLQNGLNLGSNYTVTGTDAAGDSGAYTTATDGLRNITGMVNADGTVTIYGITSTASVGTGDQGADPDKLVSIFDTLSDTTAAQASGESFTTLETASYGQVLRGVALVNPGAVPEPSSWAMMLTGFLGLGVMLRRRRSLAVLHSARA